MGVATDRHRRAVERLRRAVLGASGSADGPLSKFARKVRDDAVHITDEDVASLLAAGLTEDRILEVTLAAALMAADARLEAGLAAMRTDDSAAGND